MNKVQFPAIQWHDSKTGTYGISCASGHIVTVTELDLQHGGPTLCPYCWNRDAPRVLSSDEWARYVSATYGNETDVLVIDAMYRRNHGLPPRLAVEFDWTAPAPRFPFDAPDWRDILRGGGCE